VTELPNAAGAIVSIAPREEARDRVSPKIGLETASSKVTVTKEEPLLTRSDVGFAIRVLGAPGRALERMVPAAPTALQVAAHVSASRLFVVPVCRKAQVPLGLLCWSIATPPAPAE